MPLTLTPELEQFAQNQVALGRYSSTNEVILSALRILESLEMLYKGRFEELQREIQMGIAGAIEC